jgi:RecA-family ATPase
MLNQASPLLEPDRQAMRRQLEQVFCGVLDFAHVGLIELAWSDPQSRALSSARLFETGEIGELIDKAMEVNRVPGCNVYVGAALRRPGATRNRRASDADFAAASSVWADIDSNVMTAAAATCDRLGIPPTLVIITGRHPHLRAQLWWRLDVPCHDPAALRSVCSDIAQAIGGDPSVVNPGRVLRLGGSIAWPVKAGRVVELTEVDVRGDQRPRHYSIGQLARAFAPEPGPLMRLEPASAVTRPPAFTSPAELPAAAIESATLVPNPNGGLAIGSLSVDETLAAIRRGDHWHNNLVRLIGHWIARGWSDTEILTFAESVTLPDYTVAQTRHEMQAMIAGGRRKWGIESAAHNLEPLAPQRPPIIDPRSWSGKPLPAREWLVKNWIPMNHVTALYGDGGMGKTLLAQQLLTSVATGREWLGLGVRRLRSFGLLCEDHEDDLHFNQERINGAYWIDYSELSDLRLWPSVGFDNLLMTFDGKESGHGQLTTFFGRLLDEVKSFGARFVVLDTAADLFGGNENIRTQVRQFIANACGRIARETNGAVLLCAHPSVSGMATGFGSSGSTAWNNTVRSRLYLTQAKAEDGEQPDPDLRTLARKKSNYARAGESLTLRWSDGVMMPIAAPAQDDESDIRRRVLDEIDRAWREGQPYSEMPQARTRFVLMLLPKRLGLGRGAVERAYLALLASGEVSSEVHDAHRNLRGLRAIKRTGGGAPR